MRHPVLVDREGRVVVVAGAERHQQERSVADRVYLRRRQCQGAGRHQRTTERRVRILTIRGRSAGVDLRQQPDGAGAGERGVADVVERDPLLKIDPLGGDAQAAGRSAWRKCVGSRRSANEADVARIQAHRGACGCTGRRCAACGIGDARWQQGGAVGQ